MKSKAEEGVQLNGRGGRPRVPDAADPQRRIAELERRIAQQAVDIEFLKRALRHVKATAATK